MYQGMNGGSPRLSRTNSQICPTPEEELLEAVRQNDTKKVEQLIQRHEHLLSYTYPDENKRILLIACSEDEVEAKTVAKLLDLRANPRDHTDFNGWEPIHWAAQKTDYATLKAILDRNPGDVNQTDLSGNNALHVLIREGKRKSSEFRKCAELLIKKGVDYKRANNSNRTALDWADKKGVGEEIRAIINEQTPANKLINNNFEDAKSDEDQLLRYLQQENEVNFINYKDGDIEEYVDQSYGGLTLLQICCEKGLTRAVRHLLSKGANPKVIGSKNRTEAVMIAAQHGFSEILEVLLEKYTTISSIPSGLLPRILQNIEYCDNDRCYKAVIAKLKTGTSDEITTKLNETDDKCNTALHYAIRYADAKVVEELLDLGASLGAKDPFGMMPIQDIQPEVLERHLDNCVIFDEKSKKIERESFEVKFDYRSLIPPYSRFTGDDVVAYKDLEAAGINSTIEKELVTETEVIFYMSKTAEFKHLLKHPVIVSFLFLKWLKLQWLFWINLGLYLIFALSLVVYIFSGYAFPSDDEKSTLHLLAIHISFIVFVTSLFILIIRELFQICVAPSKYFANLENYLEIFLIGLSCAIAFNRSVSSDTRKQLSSISILLAAFELVLMLGQHPYYSTNVVMLKTVSLNFFKFLLWYSVLIIAFALSFCLLFATTQTAAPISPSTTLLDLKNSSTEGQADGEEDDKSFDDPGKSVFKTIIMLTGEFDASSINFDTFPITSKVIFALFIFMIAIILLNLLNGLAVSDTQMIKNDAELVGHITRAQHIRYVEHMLIGNILPMNIMRKLNEFCCCFPFANGKRTCRISDRLATRSCLFPHYELTFYPNKHGEISGQHCSRTCFSYGTRYLDRETIQRTNQIVRQKQEGNNTDGDARLNDINDKLNKLQANLNDLMSRLNNGVDV